jgi:hypothetical protein
MPKLDRNPEACVYHEPDTRADGGMRTIRLSPRGVRIDRALGGVKMRLAVPIEAYRGVALVREDKLQRRFYRLTLDHADADLSITLSRATDLAALIEPWSNWARFFAKPTLLDTKIGSDPEKRPRRPMRRRVQARARAARPAAHKAFASGSELFSRE